MTVSFASSLHAGDQKTAASAKSSSITIRLATPDDVAWIEHLHLICFGPGRFARAAFRVRERFAVDLGLSLIAEIDGVPVSSVAMTPISLDQINGYLLGPLATDPVHRGRGVARKLVHDVSKRALARPEGNYVLLVGDPPYYAPMGFRQVKGPVHFPGPVDPARILVYAGEADYSERLSGTIAGPVIDEV